MAESGYIRKTADFGYVQLEWRVESQSVESNKTNIYYRLYVQRNTGEFSSTTPQAYSIKINGSTVASGTVNLNGSGTKIVKSGYVDIPHNTNGSKTFSYSFSQAIGVGNYGTMTGSGTGVLPTIDRKSTLRISAGIKTLGNVQTLAVTRVSTSFAHTITYKCGTASGTICTNSTSTSISFTPPISLASQNTTGTKVSITYTITTTIPSQSMSIGSNTLTVEYSIPASVGPALSFECEDETACFDIFGAYIAGQSKLKVKLVPDTSGSYGATIASYKTTVNDSSTYNSEEFTLNSILTSTKLYMIATDTRGYSAVLQRYVYAESYTRPTVIKLTVKRCNEDGSDNDSGSYCQAKFTAKATSIIVDSAEKNTVAYTLKYKKSSETEYTAHTFSDLVNVFSVTDQTFIFPADDGSTYDVQLLVVDKLYQETRTTSVSTAVVLLHFGASGKGVGIGKIDEEADPFELGDTNKGLLDVGFNARFNANVCGTVAGLGRLPPIPENSDLNEHIQIGCFAVHSNAVAATIANMPIQKAGRLEISAATGEGIRDTGYSYLRQKFTPYKLDIPEYERDITRNNSNLWTFGEWVATSQRSAAQKVLWSGAEQMNDDYGSVELSEPISKQSNGIALVFSRANASTGVAENWGFSCHFIPKAFVSLFNGCGILFQMAASQFSSNATKYLYINDNEITGNGANGLNGTTNGITYNNAHFVLRAVIGV